MKTLLSIFALTLAFVFTGPAFTGPTFTGLAFTNFSLRVGLATRQDRGRLHHGEWHVG